MAVNQISMAINYRKNKSTRLSSGGKYYAEVDRQKTLSTRGLAKHLKDHNSLFITTTKTTKTTKKQRLAQSQKGVSDPFYIEQTR